MVRRVAVALALLALLAALWRWGPTLLSWAARFQDRAMSVIGCEEILIALSGFWGLEGTRVPNSTRQNEAEARVAAKRPSTCRAGTAP